MRIAYVLYGELLAPVVRSQTFPLLRGLAARGHEVALMAVTSPRRLLSPGSYREALAAAEAAAGGQVHVMAHSPRRTLRGLTAWRLGRRLAGFAPDVVHCRQSRAAAAALRGGAKAVVADYRGVRPEELLLELGKEESGLDRRERRLLKSLRNDDAAALAGSAAVVCVSRAFRRHLGLGDHVHVVPNAADAPPPPSPEKRLALRREFGFEAEDLVFVYSGSLAAWQCAREAVTLYAEVRKRVPNARLALLTHDLEDGRRLLSETGVEDVLLRSLTPEGTRAALPAFDVAFLLRDRCLVNEVSAPVKFAEYLHAGLPVVLTEGIGDASGWVADHGLGVVLPSPRDAANAELIIRSLDAIDASRCIAFAARELTFDVTLPLYEEVYRAALERAGRDSA